MRKITAAILAFDIMMGLLLLVMIIFPVQRESVEVNADDEMVSNNRTNLFVQGDCLKSSEAIERKKVALTFDDGPHAIYTPLLLKGLQERGVKASFFVTGEHAALYPDIIKSMYEAGHLIGNHTYTHIQLTNNNRSEYKEELLRTNDVLEKIIGEDICFVRPPYGSWDKKLEGELVMLPVFWNVDPLDWCCADADRVAEKVVSNVKDGSIILLHDCYETSVLAAFQIIDRLQAAGYEFVTVEKLLLE